MLIRLPPILPISRPESNAMSISSALIKPLQSSLPSIFTISASTSPSTSAAPAILMSPSFKAPKHSLISPKSFKLSVRSAALPEALTLPLHENAPATPIHPAFMLPSKEPLPETLKLSAHSMLSLPSTAPEAEKLLQRIGPRTFPLPLIFILSYSPALITQLPLIFISMLCPPYFPRSSWVISRGSPSPLSSSTA